MRFQILPAARKLFHEQQEKKEQAFTSMRLEESFISAGLSEKLGNSAGRFIRDFYFLGIKKKKDKDQQDYAQEIEKKSLSLAGFLMRAINIRKCRNMRANRKRNRPLTPENAVGLSFSCVFSFVIPTAFLEIGFQAERPKSTAK